MGLDAATKSSIVKKYQRAANDTGSPEVQIAILSNNIERLTGHLQTHKKDLHSRRGLIHMVNRRRKLLDYLKKTRNPDYLALIKELGIRK